MDKEMIYNKPWILQRADPYVYRHTDGQYYFTASLPEYDGIALRRSATLAGLKDAEEVRIWNKHESGIMSFHIWAPELHFLDGKWYIYFAASDKDDIWALRPYVLMCEGDDPLTDPWVEKGMMQAAEDDAFSFTDFSLDGTVFENAGRRYYVWAEKVSVGKKISNLYIAEMETPWKLKTAQVLLATPLANMDEILLVSDNGMGKAILGAMFDPQGRAGKGARCWNFLKNGSAGTKLAGALRLTGERNILISQGTRVTTVPSSAFPVLNLSDKGKPIVLVVPMLNDWVTSVK